MNTNEKELIYDTRVVTSDATNFVDIIPNAKEIKEDKIIKKQDILKRTIDILGGTVGIVFLIPLTIIIALANLISGDKGPIFYSQKRIGKNGKLFKMYKFRSMVVNAEEALKLYLNENEEARKEYEEYKKLSKDPRITKIGAIIRKTSLDEFPQFINVLKGNMSLVGPRPYLPNEEKDMGLYYQYVIKNKPGITGLWQTGGRSDVTFNDRLALDLEYYRKRNLKLDIKLIFKTITKIVVREGAK